MSGIVTWVDPRECRALLRNAHNVNARGFNQEANVNSADVVPLDEVGLIIGVVLTGVDRIRAYLRRQRLKRAEVFELDDAENVGRAQDIADRQRSLFQAI